MARVTPAEALARTDAVLLDVREPEAWADGHAPGALSVPLAALETGAPLPSAAEGRPVVAICRSGRRSRDAAPCSRRVAWTSWTCSAVCGPGPRRGCPSWRNRAPAVTGRRPRGPVTPCAREPLR
ncbi:rhodanese-like domain-containing protein [Streptomyces nigra]|uniref:rhodanese-like domain-containing protein n=1 Tax=Streptomyces nigra TaxID=1827580 RepID=UPI0036BE28E4